ncbi:MAG: radical SAM protein [Hyphomicrobiaceae bacterium]|nr:radical SAM protein [Hyphomicrobiaceae bacterium]
MTDISINTETRSSLRSRSKFADPNFTVKGEPRAQVALDRLETLWINTGTLCNIECTNCYIQSSPENDRLVYMTADEVSLFLDEITAFSLGTREIGFTGGEPFMNPDILEMARNALSRGHEVLILTNAMQPMQRKRIKAGLLELLAEFGPKLTLRVSLDHYTRELHETERGPRTWERVVDGLDWLSENGFRIAIAGRTCWNEDEAAERQGYADLITAHGWALNAQNPAEVMLFPEMDETLDVPEITNRCWNLLGVAPSSIMCATSRMVVKRKGEERPTVLPCTLLPYDRAFNMGSTLQEAARTHGGMFDQGAVKLCHPHCSRFCVLGGGSCSA